MCSVDIGKTVIDERTPPNPVNTRRQPPTIAFGGAGRLSLRGGAESPHDADTGDTARAAHIWLGRTVIPISLGNILAHLGGNMTSVDLVDGGDQLGFQVDVLLREEKTQGVDLFLIILDG